MDAERWPDLDSDVDSPQHVKKDLDDIFEGGGGNDDDQLNDTSGWSDLDIDEGDGEPSENDYDIDDDDDIAQVDSDSQPKDEVADPYQAFRLANRWREERGQDEAMSLSSSLNVEVGDQNTDTLSRDGSYSGSSVDTPSNFRLQKSSSVDRESLFSSDSFSERIQGQDNSPRTGGGEIEPELGNKDEIGSISSSMLVESGDNYQDSLVSADEREMEAKIEDESADESADDVRKIVEEVPEAYHDEPNFNDEHPRASWTGDSHQNNDFSFSTGLESNEDEIQSVIQQPSPDLELKQPQPDVNYPQSEGDGLEFESQVNGLATSGDGIEPALDDSTDTPRNIDVDAELANELSAIEKMLESNETLTTSPSISTDNLQDDLPPGWISVVDPLSGNMYFVDTINQTSQWERPFVQRSTDEVSSSGLNGQNGIAPSAFTQILPENPETPAQQSNEPERVEDFSVSNDSAVKSAGRESEDKEEVKFFQAADDNKDLSSIFGGEEPGELDDSTLAFDSQLGKADWIERVGESDSRLGQGENGPVANPSGQDDRESVKAKDLNSLFSSSTSEIDDFPDLTNDMRESANWNLETKEDSDLSSGRITDTNVQPSGESGGTGLTASLQALLEESDDEDFISNDLVSEEVPDLPDGWIEQQDPNTGSLFYVHTASGRSQWERPQNMNVGTNHPQANFGQRDTFQDKPKFLSAGGNGAFSSSVDDKSQLPEGWTEDICPASGNVYYVHHATNHSQWERPTAGLSEQAHSHQYPSNSVSTNPTASTRPQVMKPSIPFLSPTNSPTTSGGFRSSTGQVREYTPNKIPAPSPGNISSSSGNLPHGWSCASDTRQLRETDLTRPPCAVPCFGFGGVIAIALPDGGICLDNIGRYVRPLEAERLSKVPGPIDKKNKDFERVMEYLASWHNAGNGDLSDSVLLDRCLSLCYQYGIADVRSSAELRRELSKLFEKNNRGHKSPFKSPHNNAQDLRDVEQLIDDLVGSGNISDAIAQAVAGGDRLWVLALALSFANGGEAAVRNVIGEFVSRELEPGTALHTALAVLGNKGSLVFDQQSNQSSFHASWKEQLSALIACLDGGGQVVEVVGSLGDQLKKKRQTQAAHLCYVLAGCIAEPFAYSIAQRMDTGAPESNPRIVVVGGDHEAYPRTFANLDTLVRTEILNALRGNADTPQKYVCRFLIACFLAEMGYLKSALSYVEPCTKGLLGKRAWATIQTAAAELEHRIREKLQQKSLLASTQGFFQGLMKRFDEGLNKLIGDEQAPVPTETGRTLPNLKGQQSSPALLTSTSAQDVTNLPPIAQNQPPASESFALNKVDTMTRSDSYPELRSDRMKSQNGHVQAEQQTEKSASDQGEQAPAKKDGRGLFSFLSGMRPKPKKTSTVLEDEKKFYYDYELKMWRVEGEDAPQEAAPLEPPPIGPRVNKPSSAVNAQDIPSGAAMNGSAEGQVGFGGLAPPSKPPAEGGRERSRLLNRYVDTFAHNSATTSTASSFSAPNFGVGSQPATSLIPQIGVAQPLQQARAENVNRFVPKIPNMNSPEVYNSAPDPGDATTLSERSRSSSGYDLAGSFAPPPMVPVVNDTGARSYQGTGMLKGADDSDIPDSPTIKTLPESENTSVDQTNVEDNFEEISL